MSEKPRFSLRAFVIVITVICIWLGWRYTLRRVGLRELCQEMVQVSLREEHLSKKIHGGVPASSYTQELFNTKRPFVVDFIKADGTKTSGSKVDDLEKNLLTRFAASSNHEYFERTGPTYKYYEPVRAGKECVACHVGSAPGKLMAVISIQPGTRPSRSQSLVERVIGR